MRALFPRGRFAPPATIEAIQDVERALGVQLPAQLRRLYLEADGFREHRGNSRFLLSLTDEDFVGSLSSMTRFWWEEWPRYHPTLDLRPFVFFGLSRGDEAWGIVWRTGDRIITYHHHMADDYEVVGIDILEVWKAS